MSDILENLAAAEMFLAQHASRVAHARALEEDVAMMNQPMPQREGFTIIKRTLQTRRERSARTAARIEKAAIMETLSKAQQHVAMLRLEIGDRWPDPDVMDSYVFLVSEVGEVGDALLRNNYGHRGDYSRNNTKHVEVAAELGDAYLMLCTLATCLGIDLDSALQGRIDYFKEQYGSS